MTRQIPWLVDPAAAPKPRKASDPAPVPLDVAPTKVRVLRAFMVNEGGRYRAAEVGQIVALPRWVAIEAAAAGKAEIVGKG